jgi:hypothetical protein
LQVTGIEAVAFLLITTVPVAIDIEGAFVIEIVGVVTLVGGSVVVVGLVVVGLVDVTAGALLTVSVTDSVAVTACPEESIAVIVKGKLPG